MVPDASAEPINPVHVHKVYAVKKVLLQGSREFNRVYPCCFQMAYVQGYRPGVFSPEPLYILIGACVFY